MVNMSNRPWYYVKGRGHRDLIEKLIAAKREKEAKSAEIQRKANDYFDRWKQQNEWLAKSESMINSSGEKKSLLMAPFDLDYDPSKNSKTIEITKKKINATRMEIHKRLDNLIENEKKAKQLEEEEIFLSQQIEDLLSIRRQLKDRQENWVIREKKMYYNRFAKDKLRLKAFLIVEQLNYYKITIDYLSKSSAKKFLNNKEKEELASLIESSLSIVNMYLDVNYKRNSEMTSLYNEEAEKRWLAQETQWERERSVWFKLVDKVMDGYFTIYKYKLEDNLDSQEKLMESRNESLKSLTIFIEDLKKDSDTATLPNEDITYFLEVNS